MSIWRYAEWMEPVPEWARITRGEGDTPLVRSLRLGPRHGLERLYLKVESGNPSGSYKDRFAAAVVSRMLARGETLCLATSSGNTGAALAAYAASAGIACHIAIVETAPQEKLTQMLAYGAHLVRIRGFGTDPTTTESCLRTLRETAATRQATLAVSAFAYCPEGMTGVRTISHELVESLSEPAAHVFCPAGGGGLTLAVAQGFQQAFQAGRLARLPAIHCVQPEGNATIAGPLREGHTRARPVACTTMISGLQVASVIDGDPVIAACRATRGTGQLVSDDAAFETQQRLAEEEGIFCEPAGATALAGAIRAVETGEIDRRDAVVCLVTGSGFKDSASLARMNQDRACPLMHLEEFVARCAQFRSVPGN